MVAQVGHALTVTAAAIGGPAEGLLLTGSNDSTAKLWELETGLLLRTYTGFDDGVRGVAFVPGAQGPGVVAVGGTRLLRFDAAGAVTYDVAVAAAPVRGVSIDVARGVVVTGGEDGAVRVWALESGAQLRELVPPGKKTVYSVDLRPGHDAVLYTLPGGVFEVPLAGGLAVQRMQVYDALAFTPAKDGEHGYLGHVDGTITRFRIEGGEPPVQQRVHDKRVDTLRTSPDGAQLAVGHVDGRLAVIDGATLQPLRDAEQYGETVTALAWGGDGRLAIGGVLAKLEVRGPAGSQRLVDGQQFRARDVDLSRDGRWLAVATTGRAYVWDLDAGELKHGLRALGADGAFESVAFSPDGRRIALGESSANVPIRIHDVETGAELARLPAVHKDEVRDLWFTPDGTQLVSGGLDGLAIVWDLANAEPVQMVRGNQGLAKGVQRSLLSGDGQVLFVLSGPGVIAYTRGESPNVLRQGFLANYAEVLYDGVLVEGGSKLITCSSDGHLQRWDVATLTVEQDVAAHAGWARSVRLDASGASVWSIGVDGALQRRKVGDLALEETIPPGAVGSGAAQARAGDSAVWVGSSGVVAWSRAGRGDPLYLYARDDDWVVFDREGRFDGSRGAGDLVAAAAGQRAFRVEQLAVALNRPDQLLTPMGRLPKALADEFRRAFVRRLTRLGLEESAVGADFAGAPQVQIEGVEVEGARARVRYRAQSGAAPLKELRVDVDGVPAAQPVELAADAAQGTVEVRLAGGLERLELTVVDAAGVESLRAPRTVRSAERVGRLIVLSFGVSRYADARLNLGYAHKDALDVAALGEAMGAAFAGVTARAWTDEQVGPAAFDEAAKLLAGAAPEDTVVVFVAGHGAYTREDPPRYVYLTHAADVARLPATTVGFERLEALMAATAARRKLLLLDTCESGERDEADPRPAHPGAGALATRGTRALVLPGASAADTPAAPPRARERFIDNDLARRSGAVVLSSSRGAEVSFERAALQNGVFTEVLLDVLTRRDHDLDRSGTLDVDELRQAVAKAVSATTGGAQNPTVDRTNVQTRLALPVVPNARGLLNRDAP
jgi:WD40 repeat protein